MHPANIYYSERVQIRHTPVQKEMAEALAKKLKVPVSEAWRIALETAYKASFTTV